MASNREKLTAGRVAKFECTPGKGQSFLWDSHAPGLAVRATKAGSKAYIFQSRLKTGEAIRLTIGDCRIWALEEARDKSGDIIMPGARQEAARLQAIIDQGGDPRQVRADKAAAQLAKQQATEEAKRIAQNEEHRGQVTLGEAWQEYIKARRAKWSSRHLSDHEKVIRQERLKGEGQNTRTLTAGVMASLVPLPLSAITTEKIASWLDEETPKRGTQAALAFRLLRAFLNWTEDVPRFQGIAAPGTCARKISRENVQKPNAKDDSLQREQLPLWFTAVRAIKNKTISAYLQGLLITGSRRNELAGLPWERTDFKWSSLTLRDKDESKGGVDGTRTIPLTPYLASLLRELKDINETEPSARRLKTLAVRGEKWSPSPWVFSSKTSKSGKLEDPSIAHRKALAAVGLPPISLQGLRRSMATLSEWCEASEGVVAQIQGHKPSATRERHYKKRPLDLLRMWHTKIEGWMLEQAGISQP